MFRDRLVQKLHLVRNNKSLGTKGEEEAYKYLSNKGYSIPIKNWRIKYGEIDLIGLDRDTVVFIEVKTRYDSVIARRHVLDNIGKKKQYKLRTLANIFIENNWKNKTRPKFRIDVMGVLIDKETDTLSKIIHIEGAC